MATPPDPTPPPWQDYIDKDYDAARWSPWEVPLLLVFFGGLAWGIDGVVRAWPSLIWVGWPLVGLWLLGSVKNLQALLFLAQKHRRGKPRSLHTVTPGPAVVTGTVEQLDPPQVSPAMGVPCIAYDTFLDIRGIASLEGAQVFWRRIFSYTACEAKSFLLSNGTNRVFVPQNTFPGLKGITLRPPTYPLGPLEERMRERLNGRVFRIGEGTEVVILPGEQAIVTGIYKTLRSSDCFMEEYYKAANRTVPPPETLHDHPIERDWRAWCQRCEEQRGAVKGVAVPVPVFLPLPGVGVDVTSPNKNKSSEAVKGVISFVATVLPAVYLAASWLGYAPGFP